MRGPLRLETLARLAVRATAPELSQSEREAYASKVASMTRLAREGAKRYARANTEVPYGSTFGILLDERV